MKKYHKNAVIIKLSPIGGGGNPLRAWTLACFSIVKFFIDCVLTCFDILIPPYEGEYKRELIDLKKAITPHQILHKKQVLVKYFSLTRSEDSWKRKAQRGFTLAEVLITLLIIGIISILLLPVIEKVNDSVNKILWKKAYSEFSIVALKISEDYGVTTFKEALQKQQQVDGTQTSQVTTQAVLNLFSKYLRVKRMGCNGTCNGKTGWNCKGILVKEFKNNKTGYKYLSNTDAGYWVLGYYPSACIRTTSYAFGIDTNTSSYGRISVDVNGVTGPNKIGKDIFVLNINNLKKVIPGGFKGFYDGKDYICDEKAKYGGPACSYKYLYEK